MIGQPENTSKSHFSRDCWNRFLEFTIFSVLQIQFLRILALSSWDQIADLCSTNIMHEPWEIRGRFMDSEKQILRIFVIRQQKTTNNAFNRTNTSEALFFLQVKSVGILE